MIDNLQYDETILVSDASVRPSLIINVDDYNRTYFDAFKRHTKDSCLSFREQSRANSQSRLSELSKKKTMQPRTSVAVIGESGVGKTCIITRYMQSKFISDYSSTIEDFYSTQIKLTSYSGDDQQTVSRNNSKQFERQKSNLYRRESYYQLEIVDTAGMDEFKNLRDASLREKEGFIFVYDVTKLFTLRKLDDFIAQIKQSHKKLLKDPSYKIPLLVVGNKSDLEASVKASDLE